MAGQGLRVSAVPGRVEFTPPDLLATELHRLEHHGLPEHGSLPPRVMVKPQEHGRDPQAPNLGEPQQALESGASPPPPSRSLCGTSLPSSSCTGQETGVIPSEAST